MPVAANMNPGLSDDDITQRCQQAGIILPPEIVDLYRCYDGMPPSYLEAPQGREYGLYDAYLLLPLDKALQEYEIVVKENIPYNDA